MNRYSVQFTVIAEVEAFTMLDAEEAVTDCFSDQQCTGISVLDLEINNLDELK